jgi:tryptophanyl-tRNA synthetase
LTNLPEIFEKEFLFRRKIVFAHRDIQRILDAIKNKKTFAMMTGLMPSGKFHFGHALLVKQMIFYQKLGAKIYIAVADLEAYNARQKSLKELRKIAVEEYLINYAALGLDFKKCDIYFQSERSDDAKKSNAYYRLASNFSRYATFNEFKAVYGELSPGKMNASLLQAADMFHPQLPEFERKPVPVLVPVGVDQDPHLRIARDIGRRYKEYKFIQLSSTYHVFFPGLKGDGKMSSSYENSFIATTDSPSEVKNKINKYAFSGGQHTIAEHRKKGGNPNKDIPFQYLRMFFEPDDKKIKDIYEDYKSGALLTSELKQITIEKINDFLKEHQKKRKQSERIFEKFEI